MKTLVSSFLAAAFLMISTFASATVYRVNNLPGVSANFSTMSAAISAASVDDTLYVEGSYLSYGVVTLTKRLVIIGTGYFLTDNSQTQAYPNSSRFDRLVITAAGAAGSTVTGIHVENTSSSVTTNPFAMVDITANNVSLVRCYFHQAASVPASTWTGATLRISANNTVVTQCFIYQSRVTTTTGTGFDVYAVRIESGNGIVLSNNIIKLGAKTTVYDVLTQRAINMSTNSSANIINNVIMGRMDVYNSVFQNNIQIIGSVTASSSFNQSGSFPNVVNNNIGNSTQFGAANGNQSNVNMTNVFTYTPGNENVDNHYMLKAGSPAIAAGISGEDCGAYGGQGAFKLSVIPSIPAIFQAAIPATGNTSDGITINIKSKAHK